MEKEEKQKLIDIAFELVIVANGWKDFQKKSREEIGEWVAKQLNGCGFRTHPIGSSWGVLIEDDELYKKLTDDRET
jgi:hypothetical protein